MKRYSVSAVEELIGRMMDRGYDLVQLREGVLGCGDIVLLAPSDDLYHFVIRGKYLNEWSSYHTVRRSSRISKSLQEEIDSALLELPE